MVVQDFFLRILIPTATKSPTGQREGAIWVEALVLVAVAAPLLGVRRLPMGKMDENGKLFVDLGVSSSSWGFPSSLDG